MVHVMYFRWKECYINW